MALIIIEGVDCTGKTTFVDHLRTVMPNAQVIKAGPPDPPDRDPFEEYERALYDALDEGNPVICDRWHWGEKTYGPLLRGHDRLGDAGWRHIELFLAAQGAVVVYLHQPRSVIEDCLRRRGDHLIEPRHILNIEVGYQWCIRNTMLPTVALRHPTELDAWRVVQLAQNYSPSYYEASYVGRWSPSVLLFGEKRGGQPPHADRSAFVPRSATSGLYLLENMPENFWPQVAIANALETRDPKDLWLATGRPPVVTLGRWAHVTLDQYEVPHARVPHPQFVRRFHHRSLPDYGRLIAQVAGTADDRSGWRGEPVP